MSVYSIVLGPWCITQSLWFPTRLPKLTSKMLLQQHRKNSQNIKPSCRYADYTHTSDCLSIRKAFAVGSSIKHIVYLLKDIRMLMHPPLSVEHLRPAVVANGGPGQLQVVGHAVVVHCLGVAAPKGSTGLLYVQARRYNLK